MDMAHFLATKNRLGKRQAYARAFHLTPGQQLPNSASIISYVQGRLAWANSTQYSYAVIKVLNEANQSPTGVVEMVTQNRAHNIRTVLQVRDDNPGGETLGGAINIVQGVKNQLLTAGISSFADIILVYGNEPGINNTSMTDEAFVDLVTGVYADNVAADFFGVGFDMAAAHNELYRWAPVYLARAPQSVLGRTVYVGSHHYQGYPHTFEAMGVVEWVKGKFPNADFVISETDLTFTWQPDEGLLHTNVGQVYTIHSNLAAARAGVWHCDFTLQNHINIAPVQPGNGLYRSDGSLNPQGDAFERFVVPFIAKPMYEVVRSGPHDSTDVFINNNQAIFVNNSTSRFDQIGKWFDLHAGENDTSHVVRADIIRWLERGQPRPSYPGQWEPNWDALEKAYRRFKQAELEAYQRVALELFEAPYKLTTLDTIETNVIPTVAVKDRLVVATLPPSSAIYVEATFK